jgi:branched-chain amino acid transport system substrate-binding protein
MTKKAKIMGIAIIIIAIIAIALLVIPRDNRTATKETIRIGLSLPLSGGVAFLGEPARLAAEMALKDAGNTQYNYELVFEDNRFDPKIAASTASKLINIDKVLAIITFGSGTSNAINSIAENGKTSQFSLASDPTVADGEYNFIHWTPPFTEGELLAKEITRRGYKKVSVIDANHPGTLAVSNSVKTSLQGTGVEIISQDLTNVGEKDFRGIITKIKKVNPDIIVLELFSPEIELATRQIRELGLKQPITSVETFEWSSNPELFEGAWFVSDSLTPNFSDKFKSYTGQDARSGSSYVYDLVSMIIAIQEQEKSPIAPAELPSLIKKMGAWDSPVFGNVPIDQDGFFITDASVKIIKDGKAVAN